MLNEFEQAMITELRRIAKAIERLSEVKAFRD